MHGENKAQQPRLTKGRDGVVAMLTLLSLVDRELQC